VYEIEKDDLYANKPEIKSHAALIEVKDIRRLILAINGDPVPPRLLAFDSYVEARLTAQVALRFIAMTGQRSLNVSWAEKKEFDLDAATWTIPGIKLKGKKIRRKGDHVVYLSTQAVALLREQFKRSGDSQWVFTGIGTKNGALHKDGMACRLRDLGFKGEHTVHGFRATMRTGGKAHAKLDARVLETTLAHDEAKGDAQAVVELKKIAARLANDNPNSGLGVAYSRETEAEKAEWERLCREVAQGWSDWLDTLVRPALTLVPAPPPRPLALAA
jgi:integrase